MFFLCSFNIFNIIIYNLLFINYFVVLPKPPFLIPSASSSSTVKYCMMIPWQSPVPFLIKFAKTVLFHLSKIDKIGWLFQKIIDRGNEKAVKVRKAELLGLFAFVAIPLPGTGAWTASLIATLLQLRVLKSSFAILLGVIACGIIMGILSFGIADIIL